MTIFKMRDTLLIKIKQVKLPFQKEFKNLFPSLFLAFVKHYQFFSNIHLNLFFQK